MRVSNSRTWKQLEERWRQGFDTLMREEQEAIALWSVSRMGYPLNKSPENRCHASLQMLAMHPAWLCFAPNLAAISVDFLIQRIPHPGHRRPKP